MAFKSTTAINASGATRISSGDSGKEAVDTCMEAWSSAHDELAEDENSREFECEKAGKKAYLKAAPPLSGYKNICDFIACINYASMTGVIARDDAAHYLANARIALSTIYHNPNHIHERKRDGRQPKSFAKGAR
jgi:hypothetical protein